MPPRISILVADNDADSLSTCTQFLQKASYTVVQATSDEEALCLMKTEHLHLAILDLRLQDDNDEHDRSGLWLAKAAPAALPKLIWTKFPTFQDVREALKPESQNLPPAVDFVDKREGLPALYQAIKRALNTHMQINWDLQIDWGFPSSFAQLALLFEPTLPRTLLAAREAELEGLIRRLFIDSQAIIFERVLTQDLGRVLLSTFVRDASGYENHFVLSWGVNTAVSDEIARYETAVPPHAAKNNLEIELSQESIHYNAVACRLASQDRHLVGTLQQFYSHLSAKAVSKLLTTVYQNNLGQWQQGSVEPSDHKQAYLDWLGLPPEFNLVEAKLTALQQTLQKNEIQVADEAALEACRTFWNQTAVFNNIKWGTTHGKLDLGAIVTNASSSRGWLTNYGNMATRPLICDFVSLETAVLGHTNSPHPWQERLSLQRHLLNIGSLEEMPTKEGLADDESKHVQVIVTIRRLASELAGATRESYFQALYYAALGAIWDYEPTQFYPRHRLMAFAQSLTTAALIATKRAEQEQQRYGIEIDETNFTVHVDKTAVSVTPQEFVILSFLYERAGELCLREEILERIKGQDAFMEESRLNSAMSRLRQKVDDVTKRPQKYIATIRGRGYRLEL